MAKSERRMDDREPMERSACGSWAGRMPCVPATRRSFFLSSHGQETASQRRVRKVRIIRELATYTQNSVDQEGTHGPPLAAPSFVSALELISVGRLLVLQLTARPSCHARPNQPQHMVSARAACVVPGVLHHASCKAALSDWRIGLLGHTPGPKGPTTSCAEGPYVEAVPIA